MTNKVKQATKNTIKTGLKILFAIGLISWMVQKGALDFNVLAKLASPVLISFCMISVFLQVFINNIRWLSLLRGQGFESNISGTLPLSLISLFFSFVMPGGVGGDVVKGYYLLQEHPHKKFAAAMSIFMDRMLGFFIMIGTAFLAVFFNWQIVQKSPQLFSIALGVTSLFAGFLLFYFVSFSRLLQNSWLGDLIFKKLPGGHTFKRIYDALYSYRKAPSALAVACLLSVVNQVVTVGFVIAIGKAMGENDLPVSAYFFLVPLGVVVQALPISPAGIGVGQAAFYFLFNIYLGKESQLGPTAVTAMQLMNFAWGIVGAYFYLQRKKPQIATQQ